MVCGVCSGLAAYLNMDPTLVRVLWVVCTLLTAVGIGVVAYIIMAVIIPFDTDANANNNNDTPSV
jgi:phage shock protein C